MSKKRKAGTVDITPTWTDVINIHIMALEHNGAQSAKDEIRRMAHHLDQNNIVIPQMALHIKMHKAEIRRLNKQIKKISELGNL